MPSTPPIEVAEAVARVHRDEWGRVLAATARVTRDLDLAEECTQDAFERALERWPADGIPRRPGAWLTTVAGNRARDVVRREAHGRRLLPMLVVEEDDPTPHAAPHPVPDDRLRLVFTCCHPSLAPDTRVALALRTLCGLGTGEVARALLVSEATMAKRLTRARQKIRVAGIPYRVPSAEDLPDRWDTVLATTYLLFNEGYAATAGPELTRPALVAEALRLTRLLRRLRPGDPGATGLLALILLQDSRRDARTDALGSAVLLADQDRTRWDREAIAEAVPLVGEGLRLSPGHPDPYVVQAAIAACHALAPSWEETDWAAIESWYDVLRRIDDGPVVRLNHAVAVAEARGPVEGLALVDAIGGLSEYPLWHATRAALLRRLDRSEDAAAADERARRLPLNAVQRDLLDR